MTAAEVVAAEDGPFATPHSYQLSAGESFEPTSIVATWDGSTAAAAFLACCSFYSQDGKLLGRTFPASVPAGDTAVVTYSPFALSPSNVFPAPSVAVRNDLQLAGWGIFSETLSRLYNGGNRSSATGRSWYFPIGLAAGDVVTGVVAYHNAVSAASATLYKWGLYLPDGSSRVAITANSVADSLAAGYRQLPFLAAYTVPTSGCYFLGMLYVGGAGSLSAQFNTGLQNGNAAFAATLRTGFNAMGYTDAGPLADLPTSFSKVALAASLSNGNMWAGVYS